MCLSTQKKKISRTLSYINKVLSLHIIFTISSDEQDYRPITESACLRFFFYFRIKNEGVKSLLFHTQSVKMQIKKFCIEFQEIYTHCFGLAEIKTKTHIKQTCKSLVRRLAKHFHAWLTLFQCAIIVIMWTKHTTSSALFPRLWILLNKMKRKP